jgi:Transposase IS4
MPYDYFMAVFPPEQLLRMVRLTNEKLTTKKRPCMTTAELLKFIGVLILGTRFEFGSRADLWKTEATSRLFNPPPFGRKTAMSRGRFDDLRSCLTFSRVDENGGPELCGAPLAAGGRLCSVYKRAEPPITPHPI